MWFSDVMRASLAAAPLVAAAVLVCLLVAAPVVGIRPFLIGLGHCALAAVLLTLWGVGVFGVAVECGGPFEPRGCARVATIGLMGPTSLFAQLLFGLGSLPLGWAPMRWARRLGALVAVLGVSLPVYGCLGPVNTFLPSTTLR